MKYKQETRAQLRALQESVPPVRTAPAPKDLQRKCPDFLSDRGAALLCAHPAAHSVLLQGQRQ